MLQCIWFIKRSIARIYKINKSKESIRKIKSVEFVEFNIHWWYSRLMLCNRREIKLLNFCLIRIAYETIYGTSQLLQQMFANYEFRISSENIIRCNLQINKNLGDFLVISEDKKNLDDNF